MEILRFEIGTPITMSFQYPKGKEVTGQYGAQFFRKTTEGKGVYFPPIVEDKLNELKLRAGDFVAIVKRKTQAGEVRWEVEKHPGRPERPSQAGQSAVGLDQSQGSITPQKAAPAKPSAPVLQDGAKRTNTQPNSPSGKPSPAAELLNKSSSIDNPYADDPSQRKPPTRLEHALKTAVSAAAEAEKHAAMIGYNVRFTPSDIRAMGISVLISMGGRSAA